MNKIKFVAINYWNKATMQLGQEVTPEQWKEIDDLAANLTEKYAHHHGCAIHPEQDQKIVVGWFNGFVDLQIVKADTCQCPKMVEDLIAIRNYEMVMLNPTHFAHLRDNIK